MKICVLIFLSILSIVSSSSLQAQFTGAGFKIAVIDTGIMNDAPINPLQLDRQFCFSADNNISDGSTNATDGYVHYDVASTCRFGSTSDFSRADAAMVPRVTEHNFSAIYDFHRFASRHGSYVTLEVLQMAPEARIISVNNSVYLANREALIAQNLRVACGPHGPEDDVPDADRPTRRDICYARQTPFGNQNLMGQIISSGNVAAINYYAL